MISLEPDNKEYLAAQKFVILIGRRHRNHWNLAMPKMVVWCNILVAKQHLLQKPINLSLARLAKLIMNLIIIYDELRYKMVSQNIFSGPISPEACHQH